MKMIEVQLREYQAEMIQKLREALKKYRRVLLQAPTGSGKTVLASFITSQTVRRNRIAYFNCHRAELVRGTSNTFRKYGIPHGFIAASMPGMGMHPLCNINSIDTLKNRLMTTPEPDVCIWDEAHHLGAEGWKLIMDAWPNCKHIGLSATPWRLDGSGLCDVFDYLVPGPPTAWLIEQGYLSQFDMYAPTSPDMKGARKTASDFTRSDASARMEIPKRTGDIVKHWRLNAQGMRTIGFAVNRADSCMIVQRFNESGITAAHLDGDTPKGERKDIISAYANDELTILFNVALFDEGFDLASIAQRDITIDCLIDAAPTMSLSRVLQRWGRVLRPKSFAAVINDHAGNSARHGFPDDERHWTLEGKEANAKGMAGPPPPVTCTGCFRQIKRPLPDCCPGCGKRLLAEAKAIEVADGVLEKVTNEAKAEARRKRAQEENDAKTLEELVALGQRRGYPNAQQWAFMKWSKSKTRQRAAAKEAGELMETI